ncbi:MAG: ABC transporter substrate-binding protein, partial [Comamonas sp.]
MPPRFTALAAAAALCTATLSAQAAEPFKMAFIDPLSGPFANVGEVMRNHVLYAVDDVNAQGGLYNGAKLQLLQFDSKLSAQESQSALQAAIDQGARVVVTGGSG